MDKFMDNPWFLRFTALFLAVFLFYSVQADEKESNGNKTGDHVDIIRDVPVEVYYDNENLVVTGVPETVNVTVEGPINLVQTTKLVKDFTLIVDLRTLTMGKHQVRIQAENISEKLTVHIDPATVNVTIEEKITETFTVEPELNEQLIAEDFNLVSMEVVPATIEITGAKSDIEAISFVKASITGKDGISESFEQQATVRVLDRDLNKLDLSITPEDVTVKVEIVENNKDVPLVLKETGTPPEGVTIDSLSSDSERITIYGPRKVLDEINALTVNVDVSKIKESGSLEIEIPKPKGATSLSVSKAKVEVKATVEEEEEAVEEEQVEDIAAVEPEVSMETISFEDIEIQVVGLDQKYVGTLIKPETGLLSLTVQAESDIIGKLMKSDFVVSIDATETDTEGDIIYPVSIEGPSGVQWTLSDEEVTMKIELA